MHAKPPVAAELEEHLLAGGTGIQHGSSGQLGRSHCESTLRRSRLDSVANEVLSELRCDAVYRMTFRHRQSIG
jgi:hypothetical protein